MNYRKTGITMLTIAFLLLGCLAWAQADTQGAKGEKLKIKLVDPFKELLRRARAQHGPRWGHPRPVPVKPQPTAEMWKADCDAYAQALSKGDYDGASRLVEKWIGLVNSDFEAVKAATGFTGTKEGAAVFLKKTFYDIQNWKVNGPTADLWKSDVQLYTKAMADKNFTLARNLADKWYKLGRDKWDAVKAATGFTGSKDDFLKAMEKVMSDISAAEKGAQQAKLDDLKKELSADCEAYKRACASGDFATAEALADKWLGRAEKDFENIKAVTGYTGTLDGFKTYLTKVKWDAKNGAVNGEITADAWKRDCLEYTNAINSGDYDYAYKIAKKWAGYTDSNWDGVKAATGFTGSKEDGQKFFKDVLLDVEKKMGESTTVTKDAWEGDKKIYDDALATKDFAKAKAIIEKWRGLVASYGWKIKKEFGITAEEAVKILDTLTGDVATAEKAALTPVSQTETTTATATDTGTTTTGTSGAVTTGTDTNTGTTAGNAYGGD